ncbi:MFS transporter [Metallumcola ferriviriculae]|uniref:MFS transporter n=1 Tax=Metallumcola ferriviriculae TaxID=3039180 RepID=A0AAU0UK94_9FIRM|nr:MFS transporter [Desulfitibacteraceae bacterium MK1]
MKTNKFIGVLGLAGFVVMADNWVVSPILPAIANDLGLEISEAGLLITAYMIPFGLLQLIFGPLADRYGKRQVITASMLFFTVATGLCAIGVGLTDLAIYRALTGAFAASVMPVSLALIGDLFPLKERQSAIGTFMGISFLGQGLSMAIGGTIAYFLSWRGVFAVYAVLALVPLVLLLTVAKEIPSRKNKDAKFFAPYKALLGSKGSAFTYLTVLLEGIFIVGGFSYLGAYIENVYQFNYLLIGFIMTAFGIAAVIGGRISGRLAAKSGRTVVLSMGLVFAAVAELMVSFLGTNLYLLIIAVALLGLGFMLAHSSLLTIATEFAQKARGAAMSLVAFCFMGGGGIGTAIGGRIIDSLDMTRLFLIYGAGLVFLVILAKVLVPAGRVDNEAAKPAHAG